MRAKRNEHETRMTQSLSYLPAIEIVAVGQPAIDGSEEKVLFTVFVWFQEKGAHHGAESQGHYRGDDNRNGNGYRKLSV